MAIKVANNQSLTAITALPSSVSGGAWNLLETQTASSSATLSFTDNIDDTYKEYVFKFYNMHPATDEVIFQFQGNAAGGSGYNETITSSFFRAYNYESSGSPTVAYYTSGDQAQGTAFQYITGGTAVGNDNDQCCSGTLHLYDPSSTTFVKHFMSISNTIGPTNYTMNDFSAGYFNTTSAIDEIQFKFSSGNIDSGVIKLYGIS
jgi:hypothetical protein